MSSNSLNKGCMWVFLGVVLLLSLIFLSIINVVVGVCFSVIVIGVIIALVHSQRKKQSIVRANEEEALRQKYIQQQIQEEEGRRKKELREIELQEKAKLEQKMQENFVFLHGNYVAYDLETTGLNPEKCEIIEIAGVKVINGEDVGHFQELVKPKKKIGARITELTGITDEMVEDCRSIEDVLPDFITFIEKLPLVAHNADFDYGFLKASMLKAENKEFRRKHFCTMKMHRRLRKRGLFPYAQNSKLDSVVYDVLELDDYTEYAKNAHRALADAMAVDKIFLTLLYYDRKYR
jgi:exonuclease, DNA polymerase III, epsilon subunit family